MGKMSVSRKLIVLLSALLLSSWFTSLQALVPTSVPKVDAIFNANNTLSLNINDNTWMMTDYTYFTCNGTVWSSLSNNLEVVRTSTNTQLTDSLGSYNLTTLIWQSVNASWTFSTSHKVYYSLVVENGSTAPSSTARAVVFSQSYLQACSGTQVSDSNSLSSGFPTFNPFVTNVTIGGFQWQSTFISNLVMTYTTKVNIARLESAGPIVFFDPTGNVSIMLSSASNFMAHSCVDGKVNYHTINCGINGGSLSIPDQFTMDTILYFGNSGITNTVIGWADVLLARYNKTRAGSQQDHTVSHIGYTTDAGAYYYYNTEAGMNYEQTMVALTENHRTLQLPYAYYEFDSWFYRKGVSSGVVNYVADPTVFPSGLADIHNKMGNPDLMTHFRFFDAANVYSTANNGSYLFVADTGYALPLEQRFWDDFFYNNTQWGMKVFEHDWLNSIWGTLLALKRNVTLGRDWMTQMGAAANKHGIHIQLCSPYPRHLLQTLEMGSAVTQARVSPDYKPGSAQWQIGEASMFAWALGIAPYKDAFWTTSVQPGNTYNLSEPSPELQSAVSTLSAGPVMPGDRINYTDVSIIMRSIRTDGMILKPDRPAFPIDQRMIYKTFKGLGVTGPSADIWSTLTTVSSVSFYVVLSVTSYQMQLSDLHASPDNQYVVSYYRNRVNSLDFPSNGPSGLSAFSLSQNFTTLSAPANANFSLYYISPVLSNNIVLLGEQNKWTAVSQQRVSSISSTSSTTTISLIGAGNENIVFQWTVANSNATNSVSTTALNAPELPYTVLTVRCTLSESGLGSITFNINGVAVCAVPVSSSSSSSSGLAQTSSSSAPSSSLPVNTCCYSLTNPTLPSLALPAHPSDTVLNAGNPIQPVINGQGCNGQSLEFWNVTSNSWSSSYIDSNGRLHTSINNVYASGTNLQVRTIQNNEQALYSILNNTLARLAITCNNGRSSCIELQFGVVPDAGVETKRPLTCAF